MVYISDNITSVQIFATGQQCGARYHCFKHGYGVLVLCFIHFPGTSSTCHGVNITVSMYPAGGISVLYGEPLEIFCVAENYTSEDIVFIKAGKTVPSTVVNSTTRLLYIEKPEKQVSTFYCKNKKTNKMCTTRATIDSPPENVTDFNCISKNLEVLNCSWTSPYSYSYINYSLAFLINGMSAQPCLAKGISNTKYCTWNAISHPRYKQYEKEFYFNLKACNVFGCNEQKFTIDHFAVVKLDPPYLKISSVGSHSALLQWSLPNNIVDLLPCGVEHKIEYQIEKIDKPGYFRSVDASFLPSSNKTYRFNLINLPYANMRYEVRIYIKSKKATSDEFWSDFTYKVFDTTSARPYRPPEMIVGGFDQAVYESKRVINVYWKQLEEYEEAGANFNYKVLISHSGKTQTFFPDKNQTLSHVIVEDAPLGGMEVSAWSLNSNGSSANSSSMYIPPVRDMDSLDVTSFTKIAYDNGTYVLSWTGIGNIDSYTLFWCYHNQSKICKDRLDFVSLEPNKSRHVIDLPRDHKYQFAISANSGTKTSGMIWTTCEC